MPTKKLIEVALPLEAINVAAAHEKMPGIGAHPKGIHLWWARRPLAACRAVLFASIVDDPSSHPEIYKTEKEQEDRRRELFTLIERMVPWTNSNDPHVLKEVRDELARACRPAPPSDRDDIETLIEEAHRFNGYEWIGGEDVVSKLTELFERIWRDFERDGRWNATLSELRASLFYLARSWRHSGDYMVDEAEVEQARSLLQEIRARWDEVPSELPTVLDPFCGGGSIPLEAQRLGLEAHGSDLNPVAVLITKSLIEIPPKFAGCPPVNPKDASNALNGSWKGANGLAADVRYYGQWMRDEAQKRIGHLYPKAKLLNGDEATVIAWIWTRTVKCPNPACGAMMPLVRSWALSTKIGPNKAAWVEPKIERAAGEVPIVSFEVATGDKVPDNKTGGTVNRQGALCICCGAQVGLPHVRTEGKAKRMSEQLMAIVVEGRRERIYLSPTKEQEEMAWQAKPTWRPDVVLPTNPRDFKTPNYGLTTFADLFTSRQLTALTTFSDLLNGAYLKVKADCEAVNKNPYFCNEKVMWGGGG